MRSAGDENVFLQQVMKRADDSGLLNNDRWWYVLNTWARPGMAVAAAAGIILMGTILSTEKPDQPLASIADGLSSDMAATELAESAAPNPESMMAVAFVMD